MPDDKEPFQPTTGQTIAGILLIMAVVLISTIISITTFMWLSSTEAFYTNLDISKVMGVNGYILTCDEEVFEDISTCGDACDYSGLQETQICRWEYRVFKEVME